MAFQIALTRGYGSFAGASRRAKGNTMARSKLGAAAKACKGKKKGAFRACVKAKMQLGSHRKHKRYGRHHKRR